MYDLNRQAILRCPNKTLAAATQLISYEYKTVLEFGVAVGTSMSELRQIFPLNYVLYGFDCFYGLPEDWIDSGFSMAEKGSFNCNGNIPNIPNVKFYKGLFNETIPQYMSENGNTPIGLVHIDCDIYSGALTVLDGIGNCIVKDTILLMDDWCTKMIGDQRKQYIGKPEDYVKDITCFNGGVQKAFHEWAADHDKAYELLPVVNGETGRRIIKMNN